MFKRSQRPADRPAPGKADDARQLFAELSRPLEPRLVRDGMKAFADRLTSPNFRRTTDFSY